MVDDKFTQYAVDIVNGKIAAGKWVKLSCERYLSWFDKDDRYFDEEAAQRPINFISHLKHTTGKFCGKQFVCTEWQKFLLYNLYGWKWKSNGLRVIRNCYLQVARKAGKTSLISAIALYSMIADGEAAAEVDICAPSRNQAQICYSDACNYAESINKGGFLKILRNGIYFSKTKSSIRIMSTESKFGDGFCTSLGIIDETAAMDDDSISQLMTSSMGMRTQPQMIYITTANFNLFSFGKQYRDMCCEILKGEKNDDTIFSLIYEMDEHDDYKDSKNWIKVNPSLNVTVTEDYMKDQILKIQNSPSSANAILTKTFNKWCSSKSTWLPYSCLLKVSKKLNLEDFRGQYCFVGIDLASVSDLTCISIVIPYDNKYYFKTWSFLPHDSIENNANSFKYKKFISNGELEVTPGNVTDYNYILDKLMYINDICPIQKVLYDQWNSTQFIISATEAGFDCQPYSQALGNFNRSTKQFERLALSENLVIDASELVLWTLGNVVIVTDSHDNAKPDKESKMQKIDPAISMLTALGGLMDDPQYSCDIYIVN